MEKDGEKRCGEHRHPWGLGDCSCGMTKTLQLRLQPKGKKIAEFESFPGSNGGGVLKIGKGEVDWEDKLLCPYIVCAALILYDLWKVW
jgi:hypothetical protein